MGIVLAIIILGILVTVHEFGHFIVAKWCGVGVLEFSVGFGPKLFARTIGETTYSLRAIPLGGFVRMAGDDPGLVHHGRAPGEQAGGASPIEGTQSTLSPEQELLLQDESKWFLKKPYLARCAIVLAGPVFNFLFAWLLAAGVYYVVGLPHVQDGPVTVGMVQSGMPAEKAGIKSGDNVLTVNGLTVATFKEFVEIVRGSGGKPLEFKINRPKESNAAEFDALTIQVQPAAGMAELDVLEGRTTETTYRIGISPAMHNVTYEPVGLFGAMTAGKDQVVGLSLQTLRVLKALLTGILSPTKTLGGPLEIIKQTAASADEGILAVIGIMIFLNVSLGVMNLLPIPVLDGGHLTIFTIELLKGKPLSIRFQETVTQIGMVLLLTLMIFAFGNDLVRYIL